MINSQFNISQRMCSCADYNANNSWYFNGNNGNFNNNNRYNGNFRSRPFLDYGMYDNTRLEQYPIPLSEWLAISRDTMRGKSSKPCYVFLRLHRATILVAIAHQVNNCELLPTESTAHIIFEPRVREIVCAAASKRIVQTYYIRSLQPYLETRLYHPDSYSCRRGMGALRAVQRLQDYIYEESSGYTTDCWLAKVDIKAFFMSLDCFQVCKIVTDFIQTEMGDHPQRELLVYLTRQMYLAATKDHLKDMSRPYERAMLDPSKSLYNRPYYTGVPIGDWTSQTAGLIITTMPLRYLSSLGYKFIHYTDDTVIVVRDKQQWLEDAERLERYYKNEYGLILHPNKRYLQHYSKGVECLGYKIRYNRILPSDRIYHNLMWFCERSINKADNSKSYALANAESIMATINSYLGFLRWCNAYRLRREICRKISVSALGKYLKPSEDYRKISVNPRYSTKERYKTSYRKMRKQFKTIEL